MPGSRKNNNPDAVAESESNRIVLEQADLTISRIQGLLRRIPAPTR